MTATASDYLGRPLLSSPGVPLRVAVYSRLSQGIRQGVFPVGAALPRETELALGLRVSRTVVREALMLLEEDGLIRTRRGVGRFVVEEEDLPGLEELRPLEQALAKPGAEPFVRHLDLSRQEPTDFVTDRLGLAPGQPVWFREAVIEHEGTPIALLQEYLPAEEQSLFGGIVTRAVGASGQSGMSVLRAVLEDGVVLTVGACEIGVNVAGPTRARHLQVAAPSPVLVLTQTAELGERNVYLAKCAVTPSVGHLVVRQTAGA